jgi:diguanylate cyclase (GGDEF)-like protein
LWSNARFGIMMGTMFDPAREPRWIGRAIALAQRLGYLPSLVASSALLVLAVLGLTQAATWLLGLGTRPLALLAAGGWALVLAPFIAAGLLQLMFQLDAARRRQSSTATRDEATGAHNRRHFLQMAEREWARCRRYGEDGALLLVEADQHRALEARHGAACADALLRDITRLAKQSLRQPDLLARYGTAALVVFLPNTDPLGALDVAERMRERIAGHTLRWQDGGVSTTLSIGVASVGAAHLTLETLLQDALGALQAARDAGRNCVRAAPVQPRATGGRTSTRAFGLRGGRRG